MKDRPLALDEIETLGELLASIPEPSIPMEPDGLDGFLTAISLMKHPPLAEKWLPLVLDVDGHAPAYSRIAHFSELKQLIFRRGRELEAAILLKKNIDPILFEENESEDPFFALRPFSDGFLLACCLWPELLEMRNTAVQAALVGILRYSHTDKEDDVSHALLASIDKEIPFTNLDEALADLQACIGEIAEVTRNVH